MSGLFSGLKADASNIARAAAFSVAFTITGLFLLVVGIGCVTAALWIMIATREGAIVAFAVLGLIYLALGALFLALAMRRPRQKHTPPAPPAPAREPLVQIAEGFAIGMQAGRAARGPRR